MFSFRRIKWPVPAYAVTAAHVQIGFVVRDRRKRGGKTRWRVEYASEQYSPQQRKRSIETFVSCVVEGTREEAARKLLDDPRWRTSVFEWEQLSVAWAAYEDCCRARESERGDR